MVGKGKPVNPHSCLNHSKRRGGFGFRFRNQSIPEPFFKEELLTEEKEPPVPVDVMLTPVDHIPELQCERKADAPGLTGSLHGGEVVYNTVSQLFPRTAFSIKLKVQGAFIKAVVDRGWK